MRLDQDGYLSGQPYIRIFSLPSFPCSMRFEPASTHFDQARCFAGLAGTIIGISWEDGALRADLQRTIVYVLVVVWSRWCLGFCSRCFSIGRCEAYPAFVRSWSPPLCSPIALGYLGRQSVVIDGPVNRAIVALGGNAVPWLSNPKWAFVAIMIVDIWQWTPFVFLVSLAGLQALPQDITQAAEVDGASAFQRLYSITLPLMAPILWLILLLRTIDAFKVVDIVISMTLGGPGRATELYGFYVFRTARRFFNYGSAAAQGYLLLMIVMILVSLLWGRIKNLYEPERKRGKLDMDAYLGRIRRHPSRLIGDLFVILMLIVVIAGRSVPLYWAFINSIKFPYDVYGTKWIPWFQFRPTSKYWRTAA